MNPSSRRSQIGWLVWGVSALFYSYGFFHRVAPSVMVDELMRDFAASAVILGNLSAFYFYAYASLQIPVGVLLDRYGPRIMIVTAALVCTAGSILFGTAQDLPEAYVGRLLIGAGAGVSWIGALYVAAYWLPSQRIAMVTGATIALGMVGAAAGQAPLAAVVEVAGWRAAMLWAAAFALVIAGIFLIIARSRAGDWHATRERPRILTGLAAVARNRQTWLLGAYAACVAGPLLAFTGLWGVPYLMHAYDIDRPAAALLASTALLGWATGGPLAGWLSDRLRRRKAVMLACVGAMGLAWLLLLALSPMSLVSLFLVLLLLGSAGGAIAVAFATGRELAPIHGVGAMTGVINTITMGAGALSQPFIGLLLDWQWDGSMAGDVRLYAVDDFERAFATFVFVAVVGAILATRVRETHARSAAG